MRDTTQGLTQLIADIAQQLSAVYDSHVAKQYAWHIVEAVTGLKRAQLLASKTVILSPSQHHTLSDWLNKLIMQSMPLAYAIGSIPFIDVSIRIKPPILIPRPETEEWVASLITQLKNVSASSLRILDLCTGSGCIAIALAHAFADATIYAIDIADYALSLAQENAQLNNVKNITFVQSDLFSEIQGEKFDLIVSNPPYISKEEWDHLEPSVKDWEDTRALVAQDNGLELIRKIIMQAPGYLKHNDFLAAYHIPQLIIECGSLQGAEIQEIAAQSAFATARIIKDMQHHDRIVVLTR